MRRESACAIVMTLCRPCHTCILQTRYRLVYTHAAHSPHNLFLMLLMFLPHHGCFCSALGRHLLDKAVPVSSAARGARGMAVVVGCWPLEWGCVGHAWWWDCLSGVLSFTCAPCSMQNCACFLTSPCTCYIAGCRPCFQPVLWAQLGEEL